MSPSLIGRDHPAGVLRAEIARAAESHGGLVLVTGEAGIGKTTLVTGAAEAAKRLGALVLNGSCWDSSSAPGYWPWTQVVRGLRRAVGQGRWAAMADNELDVLLGETRGDGAADGFRLYDAVTSALVAASQEQPIVVVLDDLHWADAASLRLLEFAAQHTWFERLLLIGTYRDVEVETTDHPLRSLMLPLLAKATSVTLTGLEPDEVGTLMARTAGAEPDDELVAEVHRRTGGNPFFVEQTARLWRSGGSAETIAPGVADALQRRLSLLPQPVLDLLTIASVLGREFHRRLLAGVASAPVPQVDRLLDQAVAARLAVVHGQGRFTFAHDLVRETLYASLSEADRRKQHATVVAAVRETRKSADRLFPADKARHALLAGPELDPDEAADLLLAAAMDATGRMAVEETAGHYRRAMEIVEDPRRRAVIALELGAHLTRHHDTEEGREALDTASALIRELDDDDLLARLALTLIRADHKALRVEETTALLTEAHRRLCHREPGAALSVEEMTQDLTARIMMTARDDQDDSALLFGLWARHDAIWGPGTAAERERLTDELIAVGRRTANAELEHFASSFKWVAQLEQGDPRYLEQYQDFIAMTENGRVPSSHLASMIDQCIIATIQGRFDEAEGHLQRAFDSRADEGHPFFCDVRQLQLWSRWCLEGRFDDLAGLHREMTHVGYSYHRILEAITAAQAEDAGEAVRLTDLAAGGKPYPRDLEAMWLRCQAQTAAVSADPERCDAARSLLVSYSGEWLVSLYGCETGGPVDLWLGRLDLAQERWNDAAERLRDAVRSAERLRAAAWAAEAKSWLAKALLGRNLEGDASAAAVLLSEVDREAGALGMRQVVNRVARTRKDTRAPAAPTAEFRRDDAVWTLRFDGVTTHLPDSKGLRDLHFLLGRPGSEVTAVRLLDPAGGEVVVAAKSLGGDAVLDDEAKARYRTRLDQLDELIDTATELGQDARAAALDRERDALLAELRSAAGLGGRTRRLGDEAERARKTVTARIRDTLRKLDEQHPALATHLRASVTTGSSCRYAPEDKVPWRL
ncbi:ATP-binding protein [Amycolatopsis alba]|uniref:ATP-binding protein n=1 Tax=Amycolatopsis alba DSM 44262 TaxID=1125972 RepID=A0A229RS26_AMYAL|nr:AAA family ATPase [Amycolatopsis alba]OXM49446.1 ATP-binding protein [Amycolatopsis alba DSM 44262]